MKTIEEVLVLFPDTNEAEWGRLGGSWLHRDGFVEPGSTVRGAVVGPRCRVTGASLVTGDVVLTRSSVYDSNVMGESIVVQHGRIASSALRGRVRVVSSTITSSSILDDATVRNCAAVSCQIADAAQVEFCTLASMTVRGNAVLMGQERERLWLCGCAVQSGTWTEQPLAIKTPLWTVSNCGPGLISIGCQVYSFDEWLQGGDEMARQRQLDPEVIEMFRSAVQFIIQHGRGAEPEPVEPIRN